MAIIFFFLFTMILENVFNNIAVIKFKTFYPKTLNMMKENYKLEPIDYVKSIILSKIYFELVAGNEKSEQIDRSQILNIFNEPNIFSFSFVSLEKIYYVKENNTLCNYSILLSNTSKEEENTKITEEIFKIYSDISYNKYNYIPLKISNKKINDLKDSLCGIFGIDSSLSYFYDDTNFILQIFKYLNITEKSYTIKYSNNSDDEGKIIIGSMPHNYLNREYDEKNLVSFYSKSTSWEITMDSIKIEGYNISSNDFYDFISVSISSEYEGLVFSENYIDILNKIFFNEYFKKNICNNESVLNPSYTIISCDAKHFGIKDIKKFPKIIFSRYKFELNFSFEGEELFFYKDDRYYFKIYKIIGKLKQFIFGRLFLRKYLTIFNPDKKQIYFYKTCQNFEVNENNSQNRNFKIILLFFLIGLLIFLVIGIFIGKQIYQVRKKQANELNDNYLYEPNINTEKNNSLYNETKEEN